MLKLLKVKELRTLSKGECGLRVRERAHDLIRAHERAIDRIYDQMMADFRRIEGYEKSQSRR